MRNRILVSSLIVAGVLLTSCTQSPSFPNLSDSLTSSTSKDISGFPGDAVSSSTSYSSESLSSDYGNTTDATDEKATEYALEVAKYFREHTISTTELKDNPHLYEFLVNAIFKLYENGKVSLRDITEKDWYKEYLIPNKDLQKAAQVLLGTDLPETLYTNADFQYDIKEDAFRYSPFSPPMFDTRCKAIEHNPDGTITVIVAISQIEQTDAIENSYTFQLIADAEWGDLYQLISIGEY